MFKPRTVIGTLCAAGVLAAVALTGSAARADAGTLAAPHCNGKHVASAADGYRVSIPVFYYGFSPVRDCLLSRGDGYGGGGTREAVTVLQHSLVHCNGATSLRQDGLYGQDTEAVVRWTQAANGIGADGIYGPKTRRVMRWAFWKQGRLSCRRIA